MTDVLIPCGVLMAIFGLILFQSKAGTQEKKTGFWFLLFGVAEVVCCLLVLAWQANEAERDRERRTVVVTGVVTEVHIGTDYQGREEDFTIQYSPNSNSTDIYTFEADRSFFFNSDIKDGYLDDSPVIGDVVRVKFVSGGYQPEVLDFYNLTKEMARVTLYSNHTL